MLALFFIMGLLALPVNASAEVSVNICNPWDGCRPADLSTLEKPAGAAPACTGASCILGISNEMLPPPAPMGAPWQYAPRARAPRPSAPQYREDVPLFIPHLPPYPSISGPFGDNWFAIRTPSGKTYYNMGGFSIYGPHGAYVAY